MMTDSVFAAAVQAREDMEVAQERGYVKRGANVKVTRPFYL
jgi:hypothetical protein